jgi:GTP-binding protein HflX
LFRQNRNPEKAILVQINFGNEDFKANLSEFRELVLSTGADPVAIITGTRKTPVAKYFVGSGKAQEIQQLVMQHAADIVIFNHPLTPAQERNLEKLLSTRVLDRTGLILDIFAQRARTFEGKLQVELAQLQHLSTRLVRGWAHLERQKGGIGLRGPGETQLETDRRLIRVRIKHIRKRLEKVRKQRYQARRKRQKSKVPTIALVGYTNAGKSTLFNQLTQAKVFAAEKLFATLDPTLRRIELPSFGSVVLADTVGFIRHLPHDLVEAFRATLEEVKDADLLLHIVDAHDAGRHDYIKEVNNVLQQIEAAEVFQLEVFNKLDLLSDKNAIIERDQDDKPIRVWVSAKTGDGVELLHQAMVECLSGPEVHCCLRVAAKSGLLRSQLYDLDVVLGEQFADNGDFLLEVKLPLIILQKIKD